jgi:hypothetical protein
MRREISSPLPIGTVARCSVGADGCGEVFEFVGVADDVVSDEEAAGRRRSTRRGS